MCLSVREDKKLEHDSSPLFLNAVGGTAPVGCFNADEEAIKE